MYNAMHRASDEQLAYLGELANANSGVICNGGTIVEKEFELWQQITDTLNAMSGGATKDPARWKRSWYDAHVKRKVDKFKKKRNDKKKKVKKNWKQPPQPVMKKRTIGAFVTEVQKQRMIEFFNENPHALDKKYINTKLAAAGGDNDPWEELTEHLNAMEGPKKTSYQWKRCWQDLLKIPNPHKNRSSTPKFNSSPKLKVTEPQKMQLLALYEADPQTAKAYLYKKDSDDLDPWKEWTSVLNAIERGVYKTTDQWKRCWYDTFVKPARFSENNGGGGGGGGNIRVKKRKLEPLHIKPEPNDSGTDVKKKRANDRCLSKSQKVRMREFLEQNPHATDSKFLYVRMEVNDGDVDPWEELTVQLNQLDGPERSVAQWKRSYLDKQWYNQWKQNQSGKSENSVSDGRPEQLHRRRVSMGRTPPPQPKINRRVVTHKGLRMSEMQKLKLLELLELNPLAARNTYEMDVDPWQEFADTLNAMEGPDKTPSQWKKCWANLQLRSRTTGGGDYVEDEEEALNETQIRIFGITAADGEDPNNLLYDPSMQSENAAYGGGGYYDGGQNQTDGNYGDEDEPIQIGFVYRNNANELKFRCHHCNNNFDMDRITEHLNAIQETIDVIVKCEPTFDYDDNDEYAAVDTKNFDQTPPEEYEYREIPFEPFDSINANDDDGGDGAHMDQDDHLHQEQHHANNEQWTIYHGENGGFENEFQHEPDINLSSLSPPPDDQPPVDLKCNYCPATFKCQGLKSDHKTKVHGFAPPRLPCKFCHRRFENKPTQRLHLADVHSSASFACAYCPATFSEASYLQKHQQGGLILLPTKKECPLCTRTFTSSVERFEHFRRHGHKPYYCTECSYSTPAVPKLIEHVKTVHFGQPYKNHHTKVVHRREYERKSATAKVDPDEQQLTPINDEQQQQPSHYDGEEQSNDDGGNQEYKETKANVNLHKMQHGCNNCGMRFKWRRWLVQHKLDKVCEKQATEAGGGTAALAEASPSSSDPLLPDESFDEPASKEYKLPYSCNVCDLRFKYRSWLEKHKEKHSNLKAFECFICRLRFARVQDLKIHKHNHALGMA